MISAKRMSPGSWPPRGPVRGLHDARGAFPRSRGRGLERFELGQCWITHLDAVVAAGRRLTYAATLAELRRKGRMRPDQKRMRARLETRYGRPDG